MNRTPEFSIVTVCFNSERTITRTIESVLQQKFKDYEYIIVDGASKDRTMDIVKSFETKFEGRLKYISEPDKGIYDAFNKGVRMSTGKYVWIVNSDDYIEPEALQVLADFISSHNWNTLPIISGGMKFVSQTGKINSISMPTGEGLERAYKNDYIGIPHPATLVPKEIYDRHGIFDTYYKIIGDNDWFHRVYAAGEKFEFVDFVITNMSDGGISNQFIYRKSLRDRMHFLKKFYPSPITRFIHWAKWTKSFYIQKYLNKKNKNGK